MRAYHFIDSDRAYDSAEILAALNDIPWILMESIACSRRVQHITGNVFKTDEDRDRFLNSAKNGVKFKNTYFPILKKIAGEGDELRRNVDMAVNITNIYKERCGGKTQEVRPPDSAGQRPDPELLKVIKGITAAVYCYNILLCNLLIEQAELARLKSPEGKAEARAVWWHNGRQISLPHAVAGIMMNTYIDGVHSEIDDAAALIFGSGYKFFADSLKNAPADIYEIYSKYSGEEIEREAGKFAFALKGFGLPDQDTIGQAMLQAPKNMPAEQEI